MMMISHRSSPFDNLTDKVGMILNNSLIGF